MSASMSHSPQATIKCQIVCMGVVLFATGCGGVSRESDDLAAPSTATTPKNPKRLLVRWTPYTAGLADAAVRRGQFAVVNFGSADGGDQANRQYAKNEALLETDELQTFFAENDVALFRKQMDLYGPPRGLDKDEFTEGNDHAVIVIYSVRVPYKPTLIEPPTKENLVRAIEGLGENTGPAAYTPLHEARR